MRFTVPKAENFNGRFRLVEFESLRRFFQLRAHLLHKLAHCSEMTR